MNKTYSKIPIGGSNDLMLAQGMNHSLISGTDLCGVSFDADNKTFKTIHIRYKSGSKVVDGTVVDQYGDLYWSEEQFRALAYYLATKQGKAEQCSHNFAPNHENTPNTFKEESKNLDRSSEEVHKNLIENTAELENVLLHDGDEPDSIEEHLPDNPSVDYNPAEQSRPICFKSVPEDPENGNG